MLRVYLLTLGILKLHINRQPGKRTIRIAFIVKTSKCYRKNDIRITRSALNYNTPVYPTNSTLQTFKGSDQTERRC